jgi:hypothetical protein
MELDSAEYRARVEVRIDRLETIVESQDKKLDEVLQLLHASKLGLGALKGLIYLGLAIVGAWAAFKGVR